MSGLNWVDLVIIAIFLFSALSGFVRGLVSQLISLATLIVAFIIAMSFANPLANAFLTSSFMQQMLSKINASIPGANQPITYLAIGLSFTLLFAATVLIGSIISYVLGSAFQGGILGIGNRLFGAIFGLVRGFIINLVLIFLVQLTPLSNEPWWQQSHFVQVYQPAVQWLGNFVSPALSNLESKFGDTWQKVNSQFNSFTNSIKK